MNSEALVFMVALAKARTILGDVHIHMERMNIFDDVSTNVIPFYRDNKNEVVSIGVYVNGELREWVDENKKAIGVSLLVRHAGGVWVIESEYGWGGELVGWNPIDSREKEFVNFNEMADEMADIASKLRASSMKFISEET